MGLCTILEPLSALTDPALDVDASGEEKDLNAEGDEDLTPQEELLRSMISDYVAQVLPQIPLALDPHLLEERIEFVGFRARLRRRWGKGLRWLGFLGQLCVEVGAEIAATYEGSESLDCKHIVQMRLHARACQVFRELLLLLRNGYADGANSRWRTMHELAVTALFIHQFGEETAKRFLEHERIESCKAALEHARWCARLGQEPIESATVAALEAERDRLLAKYGGVFNTAYGWAAGALNRTDRFSIEALEAAIDISHLRPYYRMASYAVHAAPKSVIFSLANPPWQATSLLTGPSNAGLADPGQCGAIALLQVTVPLLTEEPTIDGLVVMELLKCVADKATHELMLAHEQLEDEISEENERRNVGDGD